MIWLSTLARCRESKQGECGCEFLYNLWVKVLIASSTLNTVAHLIKAAYAEQLA